MSTGTTDRQAGMEEYSRKVRTVVGAVGGVRAPQGPLVSLRFTENWRGKFYPREEIVTTGLREREFLHRDPPHLTTRRMSFDILLRLTFPNPAFASNQAEHSIRLSPPRDHSVTYIRFVPNTPRWCLWAVSSRSLDPRLAALADPSSPLSRWAPDFSVARRRAISLRPFVSRIWVRRTKVQRLMPEELKRFAFYFAKFKWKKN